MADSHAQATYKLWWEASQKFDYFLATSAGLVLAWALDPLSKLVRLNVQVGLLLAASAFLLLAAASALLRIQATVHAQSLASQRSGVQERGEVVIQQAKAGVIDALDAHKRLDRYDAAVARYSDKIESISKAARFYYQWRTRMFIVGLAFAISGRFIHFFIQL